MAEIKYEITKELGIISETSKGWTRELNMVSWNDRDPKFDIRDWSPDHTRMSKGISLTEEEMEALVKLFNLRNEDDVMEEPEEKDPVEEKPKAAKAVKSAEKVKTTEKAKTAKATKTAKTEKTTKTAKTTKKK